MLRDTLDTSFSRPSWTGCQLTARFQVFAEKDSEPALCCSTVSLMMRPLSLGVSGASEICPAVHLQSAKRRSGWKKRNCFKNFRFDLGRKQAFNLEVRHTYHGDYDSAEMPDWGACSAPFPRSSAVPVPEEPPRVGRDI